MRVFRTALFVLGWLAVGLVITVLVAWACAIVLPTEWARDWRSSGVASTTYAYSASSGPAYMQARVEWMVGFRRAQWSQVGQPRPLAPELRAARSDVVAWLPKHEEVDSGGVEWYQLTGFPFLALWCSPGEISFDSPPVPVPPKGGFLTPSFLALSHGHWVLVETLPLRPLWWGLIANSVIWGALAKLLHWYVRARIHLARYRRGTCPKCKYTLLAGRCAECGWGA